MTHAPRRTLSDNRSAVDTPPCGTLLCDAVRNNDRHLIDLRVRWANAEAPAVFSVDPDQLRPTTRLSAWFADDPTFFAHLMARLDQDTSATVELPAGNARLRLAALDGDYVVLAERIDNPPVSDPAGAGTQQPDLLWPILDNLPGAVALWDPVRDATGVIVDFRPVLLNATMSIITGNDLEVMRHQSLLTAFPNFSESEFFRRIVAVAQNGQPQTYAYSYPYNNETHWLDATLTRIGSQVLIYSQQITDRKRIEAHLVRRLELESIISSVSSRLINSDSSALDQCILDGLEQICGYNQADRVSIFLCSPDRQLIDCLYEWCAPGIASLQYAQRNLPLVQFGWLHRMIENQQVISLRSANELSPEATEEKRAMQAQGIRSLLSLPLVFDGESRGMVCFCTIGAERDWDATDTVLLRTFTGMLVNALQRRQDEDTVRRAYQRLQGLHRIDKALLKSSLTDEHPVVTALQHIDELISCARITVFRINHATNVARIEAELIEGTVEVRPDIELPAHIFRTFSLLTGKTVNFPDIDPTNQGLPPGVDLYKLGYRSMVLIPLFSQEQYIGAFFLLAHTAHFFTGEHLQVAHEVASQLSIALYQQQLREQVRQHTELLEQRVAQRTTEIRQLSTLQNAIVEHAGLAIISMDCQGLVKTANPAAEIILGYQADELIDKLSAARLSDADASVRVLFRRANQPSGSVSEPDFIGSNLQTGKLPLECRLLGKDGRPIPVLLTITPLQDEAGQFGGYVGMATDITALKTVEAELQRKNQELETFFDGSLDFHCICDVDGHLLKINRVWETTLGYTTDELLNQNVMNLIHPDDHDVSQKSLGQVRVQLPVTRMINRIHKKDGNYCTVEWNAVAHGHLIYASARDITKQQEAEVQLRSANRRLELATRAARQGIWELNLNDYTLIWDERLYELHGTSPAMFSGQMSDFLAIVHPDDREYMQNLGSLIGEQNEPVVAEKRIILPDGSVRHLETHCQWVLGPDGIPEKMVGVSWDITRRKQTELALRESEERYRSLVNNLKEIVFQTDLAGIWTFLNPAWEAISGFSVEEALGQPITMLVMPEDQARLWQEFQDLINLRKTFHQYALQYQHKDGSYRWAEVLAHVMLNEKQQPIGATGTITDITERKQALDALRDSEQRFREFAENVDEVFWIHASDPFRLLYVSPAYERVWGQSCASLYEDPASFINPIADEDKPVVIKAFTDYREGREGIREYRLRQADGSLKWINARNFVTKDANSNPVRYIGIASDITGQKEKELVLQQSLEREQELNKLKSQFVASASHEFRTPLSTIQSSVDLIKLYLERPGDAPRSAINRHLGVIEREISSFNELLSDILTIGRIDADKVSINSRLTDLVLLVGDVIDTHFVERKDNRAVRLRVDGPPRPVDVDPKLITHVLVNLLSNAFKFSTQNPDLVLAFDEHSVSLTVSDTGIGIPADELSHLFETFFRARNAINIPGSGLGLVIVRQMVELHGGTVQIQSEENQGTTFTIRLPIESAGKTARANNG